VVVIGDDVVAFLPEARRQAESLMLDTVRVFRRTVTSDFDPETGESVVLDSVVYEGPGRLVMRQTAVRDVDAANQLLAVQNPRLDLPVEGTAGIRSDDRFEITASSVDEGRVGVSGRVAGTFPQTLATARRLAVEVIG
jgi:hypothetical protein